MLLIIFLGLIAKLALGSDECDLGTPKMEDFDCNKFASPRPWYLHLHNSKGVENNMDCFKTFISRPENNRSSANSDVYVISAKRHVNTYGYMTNCTSSGYLEFQHQVPSWNGYAIVLAIDYDRYFIVIYCPFESNEHNVEKHGTARYGKIYNIIQSMRFPCCIALIYVSFRSPRPDEATKKEVQKILQDNDIDVGQLVEMKRDHCQ